MTNVQRVQVNALKAQGFIVVQEHGGVVRLSKGGDKRLVRPDGSTKRANHIDRQPTR